MTNEGGRFRKKPVVVDARRVSKRNGYHSVAEWCGGEIIRAGDGTSRIEGILIETLEGKMLARRGDYVIRGVSGEFYPCKPDIFEATYEPV